MDLNEDLVSCSNEDLFDAVVFLRKKIREHRDSKKLPFAPPPTENDLKLYKALPEEESKEE